MWRFSRAHLARSAIAKGAQVARSAIALKREIRTQAKAGPASASHREMSRRSTCGACPHFLCAIAPLLERVWRAGRRPPCLLRGATDTTGLRLSARRPFLGKLQTPDAFASRQG